MPACIYRCCCLHVACSDCVTHIVVYVLVYSYHLLALSGRTTAAEQETATEESHSRNPSIFHPNMHGESLPTENTELNLLNVAFLAMKGQTSVKDFITILPTFQFSFPTRTVISLLKVHYPSIAISHLQELVSPDAILNLLHVALLAMKAEENERFDHLSFLKFIVTSDSFRHTLHEYLPNGLTPLDLAEKLGLDEAVTIISSAGGRHGIWAMLSEEVRLQHGPALLLAHRELMKLSSSGVLGQKAVQAVFSQLAGRTTVEPGTAMEESHLHQQKVLDQRPNLSVISTYFFGRVSVKWWRLLGISLKIPQEALFHISSIHSSCEDRYLEVLIYWLAHNEAASWRTLLEVLGHFETKETMDQLTQEVLATANSAVSVMAVRGACWFVYLYIIRVKVLCNVSCLTLRHPLYRTQIQPTSTAQSVPFHLSPAEVGMLVSDSFLSCS